MSQQHDRVAELTSMQPFVPKSATEINSILTQFAGEEHLRIKQKASEIFLKLVSISASRFLGEVSVLIGVSGITAYFLDSSNDEVMPSIRAFAKSNQEIGQDEWDKVEIETSLIPITSGSLSGFFMQSRGAREQLEYDTDKYADFAGIREGVVVRDNSFFLIPSIEDVPPQVLQKIITMKAVGIAPPIGMMFVRNSTLLRNGKVGYLQLISYTRAFTSADLELLMQVAPVVLEVINVEVGRIAKISQFAQVGSGDLQQALQNLTKGVPTAVFHNE